MIMYIFTQMVMCARRKKKVNENLASHAIYVYLVLPLGNKALLDQVGINVVGWDLTQHIVPGNLETSSAPRGPSKVNVRVLAIKRSVFKDSQKRQ